MSDTLPGDIAGLLRRGSPVLVPVSARVRTLGLRGIVYGYDIDTNGIHVWRAEGLRNHAPEDVVLDLTDATGRAHAAWWFDAQPRDAWAEAYRFADACGLDGPVAVQFARHGRSMTPDQIATLRALVLHAAGREVSDG